MSRARDRFLADGAARWRELEMLLLPDTPLAGVPAAKLHRFAALYRALCADLSRGKSLGCAPEVLAHLDGLAARAHNVFYAARPRGTTVALDVLLYGFPRALRKNAVFMLAAALAFLAPLGFGVLATLTDAEFAGRVLPPEMLEALAEAYAKGFAEGRGVGEASAMAGFYINNNIGIAFRCFATGILFGVGSLFFLIYNGVVIGAVFGYVIQHGAGWNLFTFVCGHAPFELTAIVIAGGAGLKMGYAVIETGGKTRVGSLRAQAKDLVALLAGITAMLALAALIEGFWSPSSAPAPYKWLFAGSLTLLVSAFFALGGRAPRPRSR